MKFYFNKNENGHQVAEEIVTVRETLDVLNMKRLQQEVALVIGLALNQYIRERDDEEQVALCSQKVLKNGSPWSAKAHVLRQQPLYLPHLKRK